MKQRWYDNDPTLSMAVSLLQNATPAQQDMAGLYMTHYMARLGLGHHAPAPSVPELGRKPGLGFLLFTKRQNIEPRSFRLLESLKCLPRAEQLDMALHLINYMYLLDAQGHAMHCPLDALCPESLTLKHETGAISEGRQA